MLEQVIFCFSWRDVDELHDYLAEEWHFMGNVSFFKCAGVIRRNVHEVLVRYRHWIHAWSGVEGHAD